MKFWWQAVKQLLAKVAKAKNDNFILAQKLADLQKDKEKCEFDRFAPILKYLQDNYNYKERYSSTIGESHINNCCDNCDVLQGDFHLFHEVNSPFFIDSEEKVRDLKIYRINLKHNIIINASVTYSNTDEMIKQYGRYRVLNIDV